MTFGHPTAIAARGKIEPGLLALAEDNEDAKADVLLIRRLKTYASGGRESFGDVDVALDGYNSFARRALDECRLIEYGATVSYSELAASLGSPRAARAVGNCMAANRTPIIIPCHRVVAANGRIGSYSAPGGAEMKRRLLEFEVA